MQIVNEIIETAQAEAKENLKGKNYLKWELANEIIQILAKQIEAKKRERMREKKFTFWFGLLFVIILTGLALEKREPKRDNIEKIEKDKCPHDTIEAPKELRGGLGKLSTFRSFGMDERRIVFINKLRKV